MVRGTAQAGFYSFYAGDSLVSIAVLNPPREESLLASLDASELDQMIAGEITAVDDVRDWEGAVFRSRRGPELWWPFLLAMLLLLLGEALMATSGPVKPLQRFGATEAPADGGD